MELKPGAVVIINGKPCKLSDVQHSKPGKHGAAKTIIKVID